MHIVAAGNFDTDGTVFSSIGVESVVRPDPAVMSFEVHFTEENRRNGMQKFHWFTQQNGAFGSPIVEWFSPTYSRITLAEQIRSKRTLFVRAITTCRYGSSLVILGADERNGHLCSAVSNDNGQTWVTYPINDTGDYVLFGGGTDGVSKIYAVLRINGEPAMYVSTDGGKSWAGPTTVSPSHAVFDPVGVYVNGTNLILVGRDQAWTGYACYSTDGGATWQDSILGQGVRWEPHEGIMLPTGRMVVVGWDANTVSFTRAYSDDGGATWTVNILGPTYTGATCGAADPTGQYLVAVGGDGDMTNGNGRAMYSADYGATWTLSPTPPTKAIKSVCYHNGRFVAVGDTRISAVSNDNGATWQSVPDALPVNLWLVGSIISDGTNLIFTGRVGAQLGSTVALSEDGVTYDDSFNSGWNLAIIKETAASAQDELNVPVKFSCDDQGALGPNNGQWDELLGEGNWGVSDVSPNGWTTIGDRETAYAYEIETTVDLKPGDLFFVSVDEAAELTPVYSVVSSRLIQISFLARNGDPTPVGTYWHLTILRPS